MAVFALENGRLVSAPSHPKLEPEEVEELLRAVREQAIGLIEHPLFEVGWVRSDQRDGHHQSLLALDSSGQIVTIEVHEELDGSVLLAALARAGRHADFSRSQLGAMYPGGGFIFAQDWSMFLETTPPVTRGGPRLFLFVMRAQPDVIAPLAALNGSGVEAHRVLLHPGKNGALVEFAKIGHQPMGILAAGAQAVELESGRRPAATQPAPRPGPVPTETRTMPAPRTSEQEEPMSEDKDAAGPELNPELWNITGWNSANVPRPEPYRPPVAEEPINEAKNPVYAELAKESEHEMEEIPALDPEELAKFEAKKRVEQERTDTAIMLAEMSSAVTASDEPEQPKRRSRRSLRRLQDSDRGDEETNAAVASGTHPDAQAGTRVQAETTNNVAEAGSAEPEKQGPLMPSWPKPSDILSSNFHPAPSEQSASSMYDDMVRAVQRPEQRIWEDSSPAGHAENEIFDERDSARYAQEAVARAAEDSSALDSLPGFTASAASAPFLEKPEGWQPPAATPHLDPLPELVQLARSVHAPAEISWVSPRKGIDVRATLTAEGYIETADGQRFVDPQHAAESVSGSRLADGWRVWRLDDGRRLSDFRI